MSTICLNLKEKNKGVDYIYLYDKDAGKDGYTEFDSTPECVAANFEIKFLCKFFQNCLTSFF